MLIIELREKTLTIESRLVSEPIEYEHAIDPFHGSGTPNVQADWAPLAMTNLEARAVFEAAIRALRAPSELRHIHATRVRIVPPPPLTDAELVHHAQIGAAHAAQRERLAAEDRAEREAEATRLAEERAELEREAARLAAAHTPDPLDVATLHESAATLPPTDSPEGIPSP